MKRLREEKDNYFLWKAGQQELDQMDKTLTACEYHTMVKEQAEKKLDLNDTERNRNEVKEEISSL